MQCGHFLLKWKYKEKGYKILAINWFFFNFEMINSQKSAKKHTVRSLTAAQMVKRLPTMRETWVRSLGQEDPLDKEMATHSRILAWKIPWIEEPGRLQSMGSQSQTWLSDFTFTFTQSQGFPGGASGIDPPASAGDVRDMSWIPGSGRFPCLENPHGQKTLAGYSP